MSSSWGNVINITDEPNDMFGKVMTLNDGLMGRYFTLATPLSDAEIKNILSRGPREAKAALASEIVRLYHGQTAAQQAVAEFENVFAAKQTPRDIPLVRVSAQSLPLTDLLVAAKLAVSKSEARRLIEQGGVKVNGTKKTDPREIIALEKEVLLQVGPRRFARVHTAS